MSDILSAILELQCYRLIADEKRFYISLTANEASDSLLDAAFESICNAYDVFCGKYLDGHIDKFRFMSDYSQEIINWVETFSKDYEEDSDYQNTLKVYRRAINCGNV